MKLHYKGAWQIFARKCWLGQPRVSRIMFGDPPIGVSWKGALPRLRNNLMITASRASSTRST